MTTPSPTNEDPNTNVPASAQPSTPVAPDGNPELRVEYATEAWQVCDPKFQALLRSPDVFWPTGSLPVALAHAWMREGLDAVWALVLLEMLDQSRPSLQYEVNIAAVAAILGYTENWIADIVNELCRFGMIQVTRRRGSLGRMFKFAKHEDMIGLIQHNRNRWRRRRSFGGAR